MSILTLVMSMAVGLTFIISGGAKVFDLKTSANNSKMIKFFPQQIAYLFGFILPFIELLIGFFLIIGFENQAFGVVSLVLFLSFIFVNLKSITQNMDIPCSCFGKIMDGKMGWGGVIHSSLLLLYCIPIILLPQQTVFDFPNNIENIAFLIVLLAVAMFFFLGFISRLTFLENSNNKP